MGARKTTDNEFEHEVDISASLFAANDCNASEAETDELPTAVATRLASAVALHEGSESDDGAFIARTLTSANRKATAVKGQSVKKGGGFQAMGLDANLLKAVSRKGFSAPTPIQRRTIPLIVGGQDVVGMARTGSGKTAAFVLPMIQKLKCHSAKIGARALVLSPSRELALQTLKVVKAFSKGTDLKCVLLVGGDSLEEQFGSMLNPDIVIATPGRFLHVKVEMGFDMSSFNYVVFDEADRLFEMGFAIQLTEILHALPPTRQTLLFSATLPKSLTEFAQAGLQEPQLVRLDSESKISPDLQSAFFTVKSAEKEGALLHILTEVAQIPARKGDGAVSIQPQGAKPSKKRKRQDDDDVEPEMSPSEHATIVFAATKHHVEYLATFLRQAGFAVSHAYGALDQTARNMQVQNFRTGLTDILVVTDVAARGIDIPILANVINFDFPAQPKIFVHRVGRTARAGNKGWSYSLLRASDAPYLLDLQLFLGRPLLMGRQRDHLPNYASEVVVGSLERDKLEANCEWASKLLGDDADLVALRTVAAKGEKLYLRTRNAASVESARRAKNFSSSTEWTQLHPLFEDQESSGEVKRDTMLARISGYRPAETVFEIGKRGEKDAGASNMRRRRETVTTQRRSSQVGNERPPENDEELIEPRSFLAKKVADSFLVNQDGGSDPEDELEITVSGDGAQNDPRIPKGDFKSADFFMEYTANDSNTAEDRGYGVHTGSTGRDNGTNFLNAAQDVSMDLVNDEGGGVGEPSRHKRWDKKAKNYVRPADKSTGSKSAAGETSRRYIRSESGQKIAATFRSGRFEAWKKANNVAKLPRTGDSEVSLPHHLSNRGLGGGDRKFKYHSQKAPKMVDKYRDDYFKKKKKLDKAKEQQTGARDQGKGEVRNKEAMRKSRREKERRREKSSRGKGPRGRS